MSAKGTIKTRSAAEAVERVLEERAERIRRFTAPRQALADRKTHSRSEPMPPVSFKEISVINDRMDDDQTMSLDEREARISALRRLPTMTVEDAAFVLGISRASAFLAVDRGEIRVKQIGKRRLVLTRPLFLELDGVSAD